MTHTSLYILPGTKRCDDLIRLPACLSVGNQDVHDTPVDEYLRDGHNIRLRVDMQAGEKTYPYLVACEYFPCETLAEVASHSGFRHLILEPMADSDPLVRSQVTRYAALTDGTVYKMVQMSPDLVFVRQLSVSIRQSDLAVLREQGELARHQRSGIRQGP